MISVIIPVYNAEKTLRRCVDSVLEQTCSDLEAVLVDDGSTDRSGSIVDEYARKDERVKAVHQENRGLSCARNSGLDRASGAYIAFADADDWLETDALGTALAALTAYPEADICAFGRISDMPGKSDVLRPAETETVVGPKEALDGLLSALTLSNTVWDKLYRAELFNGLRFPEGYCFEDIFVVPRLITKARRLVLLPDLLYHYVQTAGSIVHTPSLKNQLDRWTARRVQFEHFAGKCPEWRDACVFFCVSAAANAWTTVLDASPAERDRERARLDEALTFVRAYLKDLLRQKKISVRLKAAALLIAAGGRGAAVPMSAVGRIRNRRMRKFVFQ